MNKAYDYNGTVVAQSKPKPVLRLTKKKIQIDSSDRDRLKYYTNGDFVVYLPRMYESVVTIRLISAEFPPLVVSSGMSVAGARKHYYRNGPNTNTGGTTYTNDIALNELYYYFEIDIDEANKIDETTVGADKSTFVDGFFAHIPVQPQALASGGYYISYNDKSGPDNVSQFNPPIRKLDRMRIRTRTHDQQGDLGFIYWTTNGAVADKSVPTNTLENSTSNTDINFTLTFEIEYLDNGFDDFSSFETRVSLRN
jgi:hypothetical protein